MNIAGFPISQELLVKLQELITSYGLNLIFAIAIFIFGKFLAKIIKKIIRKIMTQAKIDGTLITFTQNLVYSLLIVFVILASISRLGIQTTSLIAVLGAAGLAVGLALQGSLSNFAAGILMIIFKPFKIDDFIEGGGTMGIVKEIGIFTTTLKTPDNKVIIIPNSKLTGDNIINYSKESTRRVDMVVGCSYSDDLNLVKTVLDDILKNDERILSDPAHKIAVTELGDSSINFIVRPWVKSEHYWDVYYDTLKTVKDRFDAEGISIPFPQRDVHMYEEKKA